MGIPFPAKNSNFFYELYLHLNDRIFLLEAEINIQFGNKPGYVKKKRKYGKVIKHRAKEEPLTVIHQKMVNKL